MLVDHRLEPLTFKLIDYGLAISSSKVEAELGKSLQPIDYRWDNYLFLIVMLMY